MTTRHLAVLFAATAAMTSVSVQARAQETTWQRPAGSSGNWFDAGNWTLGTPGIGQDAAIENGGGATIGAGTATGGILSLGRTGSGKVTQTGGVADIREVYLGNREGISGTWIQSGGQSNIAQLLVGESGGGLAQLTGGHMELKTFTIAQSRGTTGTFEMGPGTTLHMERYANLPNTALEGRVGLYGTATFKQTGGSFSLQDTLQIGVHNGSNGTYTITGGTSTTGSMWVGIGGKGTVNQSNATVSTGSLYIGYVRLSDNHPSSIYTISSGSFTADTAYISLNGRGSFKQTGGDVQIREMYLGHQSSGPEEARYDMTGGTFASDYVAIGYGGAATFHQTGGLSTIDHLVIYERGQYKQTGGRLIVRKNLDIQGELDFDGFPVTVELDENASAFLDRGTFEQAAGVTFVGAAGSFLTLPAGTRLGVDVKTITSDGIVHIAGEDLAINAGQRIGGSGNITGDVTNSGLVAPGNSPGLLSVSGNFDQASDGELLIEIAGTGLAQFDRLEITGNALLDGTLSVELLDGFVPGTGDVFTFLTAGGIDGLFDNAVNQVLTTSGTGQFDIVYGTGCIKLTNYQAVPEPGAVALLAIAGASLIGRRRRR